MRFCDGWALHWLRCHAPAHRLAETQTRAHKDSKTPLEAEGTHVMSGAGRQALAGFVAELQQLRAQAGMPSLQRLVRLTAGLPHPLARSTISDKLNAKSLPVWDFVVSFVRACVAHADHTGKPLPAGLGDLALWETSYWRMVQHIDAASADDHLVTAARAEIATRPPAATPAGELGGPQHIPRQVPSPTPHFVGRTAELAALTELVPNGKGNRGTAVMVTLCGMAGVGKTAVALHWAHQMVGRFPDGQLYANLRGFGPTGALMTATDVLPTFLETLGVPARQIPHAPAAQIGLYRSLLMGKQILIVLDNARDSEHVRPLLPAAPGSMVLVTSRDQLAGLIVSEGAHPIPIEPLSTRESRQMLARRLGGERIDAEPLAVQDIVAACGGLPLTLAIVAGRATVRRGFALSALAVELLETKGLDAFSHEDAACDARAVISWSYDRLGDAAARLLRLIGLHPGPDFTASAAAGLAGVSIQRSRSLLGELANAHLLVEHTPGRYSLHDLLRAYAAELALVNDSAFERGDATQRLLDHYLHSAFAAANRLDPHLYAERIHLRPPLSQTHPDDPPDAWRAKAWFTAEYPTLSAAIGWAAESGYHHHAWQLAWTLGTFLNRQGRWQDWSAVMRTALDSVARLDDTVAMATVHCGLGNSLARLADLDQAEKHLLEGLKLYESARSATGRAYAHHSLAWTYYQNGRPKMALSHNKRANRLFRATGSLAGQADTLNAIGWQLALQGDLREALSHCEQAQAIFHEIGDADGEAAAWDSLGYIHHQRGQQQKAIDCYQRALEIYHDRGDRYYTADTLIHLADTHDSKGEPEAARAAWRHALSILDDLRHPDADGLRARLEGMPPES